MVDFCIKIFYQQVTQFNETLDSKYQGKIPLSFREKLRNVYMVWTDGQTHGHRTCLKKFVFFILRIYWEHTPYLRPLHLG